MKENWMNKLIELLDEYDSVQYHKINHKIENWEIYRNVWGTDGWSQVWRYSKSFWFIQRLAKHFMLNVTKLDARIALSDFNATDRMLMALAISDNPIELLIDCLE